MSDSTHAIYHPCTTMKGLPFSEAVQVGNVLYLAGQVGLGDDGKLVHGGIGPETRRAMENVRAILERHGSSLDRVVKVRGSFARVLPRRRT